MEIKQFADVQLGNRYVKVFIEPGVKEEVAKKALDSFIKNFENNEILEAKDEPMDFLIIQNDGITGVHKNNNNQEPHCFWFKDLQISDITDTVGCENILDKYTIEIPNDWYSIPINNKDNGE